MARVFAGVLLVALVSATAGPLHAERTRKPAAKVARTPEQRQALDHLREGQRLMRAESFDAAAREFGLAVHLDPLLVMAHYGRGQAQMALKDFPAAVQAYLGCREAWAKIRAADADDRLAFAESRDDEIRELRDTARDVEATLRTIPPNSAAGAALLRRLQRLQNQIDALEQLRGVEVEGGAVGTPASLSLALGSAYFRDGRLADAEREYKAAVAARSSFGEAHSNLAVLYLQTGRPAEAMEEVRRAAKAGFRVHPDLRKTIEKALEAR